MSGVHVYTEYDSTVLADNNFICCETTVTDNPKINLCGDGVFEELFDGGIYTSKNKILSYSAKPGTVKMFVRREE